MSPSGIRPEAGDDKTTESDTGGSITVAELAALDHAAVVAAVDAALDAGGVGMRLGTAVESGTASGGKAVTVSRGSVRDAGGAIHAAATPDRATARIHDGDAFAYDSMQHGDDAQLSAASLAEARAIAAMASIEAARSSTNPGDAKLGIHVDHVDAEGGPTMSPLKAAEAAVVLRLGAMGRESSSAGLVVALAALAHRLVGAVSDAVPICVEPAASLSNPSTTFSQNPTSAPTSAGMKLDAAREKASVGDAGPGAEDNSSARTS